MSHPIDSSLTAWADAQAEEAERRQDPYVVYEALHDRLRSAPTEREPIAALLERWVVSTDVYRWHPALLVISEARVTSAAAAVRNAAAHAQEADDAVLRGYARLFESVADDLEAPEAHLDLDPPQKARWEAYEQTIRRVASELLPALDAGAAGAALHQLDDGEYASALLFAASGILRADDRPAARAAAKQLRVEIPLLLTDPESTAEERLSLEQTRDRLQSVLDGEDADAAVPTTFRIAFTREWEARAETSDGAGLGAEVQRRLDLLPADDPEGGWIKDILIGWLFASEPWQWQTALEVLTVNRVPEAVQQLRWAGEFARSPEKAPFAGRLLAAADELERVLADHGGAA